MLVGKIKEIPGVLTQGVTIEETKDNLMDALNVSLNAMQSEIIENQVLEEVLLFAWRAFLILSHRKLQSRDIRYIHNFIQSNMQTA